MSETMIGAGPKRVDGRLKVTGQAPYTSDNHLPNMAYAYGVFSTIAKGEIINIDLNEAINSPGVIDIFYHDHFPRLYRSPASMAQRNRVDETRTPFEDNKVYYAGQFVALVVANTFEQARAAAYKVKVDYRRDSDTLANLDQGVKAHGTQPGGNHHSRGDEASAFERAPVKIDAIYTTPVETHNPMEMHATVASWEGDRLTMYEATQGVVQHRGAISKMLGISPSNVEVRSPFIGSGFGAKLFAWPHSVATAAVARQVGRPVQMVVPRQQMFTTTGHRAETRQHLRLSADSNGKITSMLHDSISSNSYTGNYVEVCGRVTKSLYSCPNVTVDHAFTQINRGTPTSMRAPGAAPGLFALESAIDELALAAGMDPVDFRLANYAERDESMDLPFSGNHIVEATQKGAEKFGWYQRNPAVGSMRDGNEIIGYGVAACNWEAYKQPCDARVSLRADGTAFVSCAAQDIGTGTYTVIAQAVSELTGLPLESITVKLGDTSYPDAPLAGGSWTTSTVLPAVAQATRSAIDQLKSFASGGEGDFGGLSADDITFENAQLSANGRRVPYADVLAAQRLSSADGEASTEGMSDDFSFRSFGVHFVEVRWDPGISRMRVSRVVSAIDVGRVINSMTAANQVEGAVVMGLGMANFEAAEYDARNAMPVNNNYAEYLVPVHADQPPEVDVILLDYPDYNLNEYGARGLGEIGITGMAAAVANAVYHATGKRIRDLPLTLEKLMA